MKKSFMTRVLAAGLSFAMAFSMAAATSVTTASAASKPAMITSSGASAKSLDVKLGEAVKIKVNAATKKTYKVSAVKPSSSKVRVAKNKAGTVVTIRGLKATEEGKPASVKVSFKVKKTGKASKYSYVSKVNVIEDKQTITAVQSKVRAITVTSNKSMEGQDIKVVKGATDVKFTSELSADGKTAVLKFESDLAVADYTVTVGELTATVKGELSKVANIEIKSDVIAMNDKIGTAKEGYAGYVVTNQFEEDVTKSVSVTANSSATNITAADGKITVNFTNAPNLNDVVSVVLIYQSGASGAVTTSKTLKVSNQSVPYEVETYGVYNEDKKTLSATNALTDDFYYLFRVKDQYGNYMGANNVITAITSASPSMYVNSTFGLTGLKIVENQPKKVTVDGVDYVGYLLVQDGSKDIAPGSGSIMLIPGGSGTTVTATVEVATGSTVTNLVVTPPSAVASNAVTYLDFKATDADGNEITDYNTLKKIQISNPKFSFVKKDGTTKLKLDDVTGSFTGNTATNAGSVISVVFTLQNFQTVVVTVNVLEANVLNGVASLDAKQVTAAVSGDAVTIPVKKFNGENQYGGVLAMTQNYFNKLGTTGSSIVAGDLYLMIVPDDANNDIFTEPTASVEYDADGKGQVTKGAIILGATDSFVVTGAGIGTESYTVRVVEGKTTGAPGVGVVKDYKTKVSLVDKNITASSSFTFTLTSTQANKYKSFEVEGPETIYAVSNGTIYGSNDGTNELDAKYYGTVKAYGIVAGGARVQLKYDEYKVTAGANLAVTDCAIGTGCAVVGKVDKNLITATNKTVVGSYTVTINATGEEFKKEVTVNTNGVGVASLAFVNPYATDITLTSGTAISGGAIIDGYLKGKDSYGVDLTVSGGVLKILASNDSVADKVNAVFKDFNKAVGSTGTITDNGDLAKDATITGYAGDSCTVVIKAGDKELFTTSISWN